MYAHIPLFPHGWQDRRTRWRRQREWQVAEEPWRVARDSRCRACYRLVSRRQGRRRKAIRGYRRRRVTPYSATTPMRPTGCGGAGTSPALSLLPDAYGIAFVAPPWICGAPTAGGSGARNATRQGSSATC
jgi:hypothetical protein